MNRAEVLFRPFCRLVSEDGLFRAMASSVDRLPGYLAAWRGEIVWSRSQGQGGNVLVYALGKLRG